VLTDIAPVHVMHVLEATEGGTRRWLENVLLGANPSRIRNSCICSTRRDRAFLAAIETFRRRGIAVHVVDMRRQISPIHDYSAVMAIAAILNKHPVDIVHAHSSKAGMLARLAARFAKAGLVVYSPHAFSFLMRSPLRHAYWAVEKIAVRWTDYLLAVSESERDLALEIGFNRDRIRVICNGVELPPAPEPLPAAPPVVGFFGNLRDQKDPLIFLAACARVHATQPDVRFEICGAGALLENCRCFAARAGFGDAVTFHGWVEDIQQVLQRISVFVSCSRYEGLSFALLEAMAAARPIVATRTHGNEEMIADGENGLLVPINDAESTAHAILRLIRDPSLADQLGQSARQTIAENYSLANQLRLLTEFYEEVARKARKAGCVKA